MINIVVEKVDEYSEEKFAKTVEILAKAFKLHFKIEQSDKKEYSLYQSIRDVEKLMHDRMDKLLYKVFRSICSQWLSTMSKAKELDPFKLGKVRINPKTGKLLTKREWKDIKKSLDKVLKYTFHDQDEYIAKRAIALGKILETMPPEERITTPYSEIDSAFKLATESEDDFLNNIVNWAELNAAEYITDLTARARKGILQQIIEAEKNEWSSKQLEEALFDKFADLNKDWRKIAETEHAYNVTDGFLSTKLQKQAADENTFLQGVAVGEACLFCRERIDGAVVVLLKGPPKGGSDKITIEGTEYTAIWPGKNNVGRSRADWWICIPSHPHCYDNKTEVLTNSGWKLFKDVLDKDLIMAINPESREVGFVPFVKRVQYKYEGEMIHFKGRNYDLMVTPDHNMLFSTTNDKDKLRAIAASELLTMHEFKLPRAVSIWTGSDKDVTREAQKANVSVESYVKLWGWFLSEGSVSISRNDRWQLSIAQKDPTLVAEDLREFGSRLKVGKSALYIFDVGVIELFKEWHKVKSYEKYIPAFIKGCSSRLIKLFLFTYIRGDGNRYRDTGSKSFSTKNRRAVLFTSSDRMMADLSELVVKIGRIPSFMKQLNKGKTFSFPNGTYQAHHDVWIINICKSKFKHFCRSALRMYWPQKVQYTGMVYDVELEKWHYLLVRRNGKVAWSGNCKCSWLDYILGFEKYNDMLMKKLRG